MVKNTPSSSLRNSYISLPPPISEATARIAALEAQVAEFARAKREIEERAAAMGPPPLITEPNREKRKEGEGALGDSGSTRGTVKTEDENAEEAVAAKLADWVKVQDAKDKAEKEKIKEAEEKELAAWAFFESERLRAVKDAAWQAGIIEEKESYMDGAKAREMATTEQIEKCRAHRDYLQLESECTTQWLEEMYQEEAAEAAKATADILGKLMREGEGKRIPTRFEKARQMNKENQAMIDKLDKELKERAGEISNEENEDILSDAELDVLEKIQKAIEKETENEKPAMDDHEASQYTAADESTKRRLMLPSREPTGQSHAKKRFLERKAMHEQMPYPRFTYKRAGTATESSSVADTESILSARNEMLEQTNASQATEDSLWSPQLNYKRVEGTTYKPAAFTGAHFAETAARRAGKNQAPRGYWAFGRDTVPESSDSPSVIYKRADGTETARMVPSTFMATPAGTSDSQPKSPLNGHGQKTKINLHRRPVSGMRLDTTKDLQQKSLFEGYSQETMKSSPLGLGKKGEKSLFEKFTDELEARKRKGEGSSLIAKGLVKEKERELEEFAIKDPAAYTKPFCDFLTENPTVFHAVAHFEERLGKAGFVKLSERKTWDGLVRGGKYYVNRNGSTLIAFTIGSGYKSGNGVAMIAGHIDALTAKLKPISNKKTTAGYVQLGIAPYAGALNSTWWDRDLGIGGRVLVKDSKGKIVTKLVKLDWPIARIPTLAPHFGIGMTGQNNKETDMVPIIGLDTSDPSPLPEFANLTLGGGDASSFAATQPPRLVRAIAGELAITDYSSIVNWELELYDTQPAQTLGLDKEFISGGRIDDKLCSWAAIEGLLASTTTAADTDTDAGPSDDGLIRLVALFDDEEIGSNLRQGAKGNFLPSVIARITESLSPSTSSQANILAQTYANSFLLSADVIHAANPNFLSSYLPSHAPLLNTGLVISCDANGHFTTDSVSTAILTRIAEKNGDTLQVFMIRNDSRSGGTVGPVLSAAMGVRGVDVGLAQLSMHSIRATTGSLEPGLGVRVFKGFFDWFEGVDGEFE